MNEKSRVEWTSLFAGVHHLLGCVRGDHLRQQRGQGLLPEQLHVHLAARAVATRGAVTDVVLGV